MTGSTWFQLLDYVELNSTGKSLHELNTDTVDVNLP